MKRQLAVVCLDDIELVIDAAEVAVAEPPRPKVSAKPVSSSGRSNGFLRRLLLSRARRQISRLDRKLRRHIN